MDAGSTWFHRELGKRLVEAEVASSRALVDGAAADFSDYRYRVGFHSALRQVQAMCEEIADEQDKPKKETR